MIDVAFFGCLPAGSGSAHLWGKLCAQESYYFAVRLQPDAQTKSGYSGRVEALQIARPSLKVRPPINHRHVDACKVLTEAGVPHQQVVPGPQREDVISSDEVRMVEVYFDVAFARNYSAFYQKQGPFENLKPPPACILRKGGRELVVLNQGLPSHVWKLERCAKPPFTVDDLLCQDTLPPLYWEMLYSEEAIAKRDAVARSIHERFEAARAKRVEHAKRLLKLG